MNGVDKMNVRKYLLIVLCTTFIFAIFSAGFVFVNFFYSDFGLASNMPDGTNVEEVKSLDPVDKSDVYNILVLGVDVEARLTDVMMLCQVDPIDHEVNILSIPRDTRVSLNGHNAKINSAFSHGGVEQVIKTVKSLTGLPVHHYFLINTTAFRDVIDALGGVYFTVPRDMNYEDPLQDLYIHLKEGYQLLDGDKAEQLVRFRRYANGDIDRIAVQQQFMQELIAQKLSAAYIVKIPEVYSIIEKNSGTDMSPRDMLSTGKQLLAVEDGNFNSYTVPGEGTYIGEVSYFVTYEQELKNLINETFTNNVTTAE